MPLNPRLPTGRSVDADDTRRFDRQTRPATTSLYTILSMIDDNLFWTPKESKMGRRDLLTDDERRALFGIPDDHDALVRLYTLSRADLELVRDRRGDANRLGLAVQLAMLRHPGFSSAVDTAPPSLVAFIAAQIDVPAAAFAGYGAREQTVSDHARVLMSMTGLRPSAETDFLPMIEAAAAAAWSTDRGVPIAAGIADALRADRVLLPTLGRLERAGIAGRARARLRTYTALLDRLRPISLLSWTRFSRPVPAASRRWPGYARSRPRPKPRTCEVCSIGSTSCAGSGSRPTPQAASILIDSGNSSVKAGCHRRSSSRAIRRRGGVRPWRLWSSTSKRG